MILKRKITVIILSSLLFVLPGVSFALRCDNGLVNVGYLKQRVLVACGNPYSKEIIGYIDKQKDGDRIRVMKIEEWIINKKGNYYSLIFEGNKLIKIETAVRKK